MGQFTSLEDWVELIHHFDTFVQQYYSFLKSCPSVCQTLIASNWTIPCHWPKNEIILYYQVHFNFKNNYNTKY